jgi:PAS domain S-box-containing protein
MHQKKKHLEDDLPGQNLILRARLEEAEETLRAIREGEVDAIVVSGSKGEQIFSLSGADRIYRLIVETMKEAALTLTGEGKILFCNRQFSKLVKTPQMNILGRPLIDFVAAEERERIESLLMRRPFKSIRQRIMFCGTGGRAIPAHFSANLLNMADESSICVVATDLTELESSAKMLQQLRSQRRALEKSEQRYRQIVEELVNVQEELEIKVHERTSELGEIVNQLNLEIAQRQSVERALKERSEQLSKLASQLAVAEEQERRRIAEILHDDLQQLLVGAKLQVGSVRRSPDKVLDLVPDLEMILSRSIEVTRSLTSELSPPILRQSGLVAAFEWLSHWIKERHDLDVMLEAETQLAIPDEDTRVFVFRAVRELLFNVVKHAHVKTAFLSASLSGNQIRIQVSDEGNGYDTGRSEPGTGFGLFSIRERLESIGGRMQIDSAVGKGCAVTIFAPLKMRAMNGTTSKGVQIRVLVADDHVIMRQGLTHLLKAQPDMDVVAEASDGEAAIRLARQYLPDVIVMDVSMPIINGAEATRVIHSEMPDVQVIGLSMFDEQEKGEIMRRAGAVRYMVKSGPSHALILAIREVAHTARSRVVAH